MAYYGSEDHEGRDGWGDEGEHWEPVQPIDIRVEERQHARELEEDELEEMLWDGEVITADGCSVEPDGTCPHGYRSPLLVIGVI